MSKRMKLALLALLGFSTACSTVKNGTKTGSDNITTEESINPDSMPRIRVLYGAPTPRDIKPVQSEGTTPDTDSEAK